MQQLHYCYHRWPRCEGGERSGVQSRPLAPPPSIAGQINQWQSPVNADFLKKWHDLVSSGMLIVWQRPWWIWKRPGQFQQQQQWLHQVFASKIVNAFQNRLNPAQVLPLWPTSNVKVVHASTQWSEDHFSPYGDENNTSFSVDWIGTLALGQDTAVG